MKKERERGEEIRGGGILPNSKNTQFKGLKSLPQGRLEL